MKKYHSCGGNYGQGIADRVMYWQKMGVAKGIINLIKHKMSRLGMNLDDWVVHYNIDDVHNYKELHVTVVVPTPDNVRILYEVGYPLFHYWKDHGVIDMVHFDDELQFHFMTYDRENGVWVNKGWHTVREGLDLQETCLLYEYLDDRLGELRILSKGDSDMYNSTGALIPCTDSEP